MRAHEDTSKRRCHAQLVFGNTFATRAHNGELLTWRSPGHKRAVVVDKTNNRLLLPQLRSTQGVCVQTVVGSGAGVIVLLQSQSLHLKAASGWQQLRHMLLASPAGWNQATSACSLLRARKTAHPQHTPAEFSFRRPALWLMLDVAHLCSANTTLLESSKYPQVQAVGNSSKIQLDRG